MAKPPVVNASPLIFLSRASLLDLLKIISEQIFIPDAVVTEIQQYGKNDITVKAVSKTNWLKVIDTPPIPKVIQDKSLGAGESAVLTWSYLNPGTEVIIDDLAARRCASALGIPVRGTLGIVLVAKKRGEISAARPILEQLCQAGMYLSQSVINQALSEVGE